VAQLERPHLLHPEAELLIGVLEGVVEIFLLLRVLDDEVLQGWPFAPDIAQRPASRIFSTYSSGMGSGLMRRTAHARGHDPVQDVVVGFGLDLRIVWA